MTLSSPEPRPVAGNVTGGAPATAADPRQDPAMRSLYRMSRTAGVGLQDYAAVNVFAVVGVILAVASVLVLIFADVPGFLFIPAAAIVISVIAFVQIQRSNGTQTGRAIAVAGILIAGGLAATSAYGYVRSSTQDKADTQALRDLVSQFEAAALAGKASDAYALFDTRFHEQIQAETFARTFATRVERSFGTTKIASIKLGELVHFETDANGVRFANALVTSSAPGTTPDGRLFRMDDPAEFHKVDDAWKFRSLPNWFAPPAAAGGTQRAR